MIGLTRQTRDRHKGSTQNPLLFRTVREYNGPRNCTTGALLTDEEVLRISDAAPGDTVASWCWGVLLDPEGLWV
jgi:hypothetical protein